MKVLLDENLPHTFRHHFPGHGVATALWMGWGGIQNGELLDLAETHSFEVFVTTDQGIPFQQNIRKRKIALVVLVTHNNRAETLQLLIPKVQAALDMLRPGDVVYIED
jgi:predicted nuclease of predicted toxin-antitoxin system